VTLRKDDIKKYLNKKFLEVQKPFFKKVFGRRRHKLMVCQGKTDAMTLVQIYVKILIPFKLLKNH
jgi:hypothetical protein